MTTAILINCFQVPAEREEEFLKLWHEADALLRTRGGYLTTRLYKALQPDSRYQYINIAEPAGMIPARKPGQARSSNRAPQAAAAGLEYGFPVRAVPSAVLAVAGMDRQDG